MMQLVLWTMLAAVSATLNISGEYRGPRRNVYLFKPLTILFIILIALQAETSLYQYLIVAGLLFSLAGDIFLMLPSDRFIAGLFSFLIAHLCYIAAFTLDGARRTSILAALLLLVYGGLMLRLLFPYLGRMKVPVMIYMLVILLMVWQAANRCMGGADAGRLLALMGALLFAASDSLLAVNRFRSSFRSAQLLILTTYFVAQWLLALSTHFHA